MVKKNTRIVAVLAVAVMLMAALVFAAAGVAQTALSPQEALGEHLYFDTALSDPDGQACASCHEPGFGFVDPDSGLPVSEGVIDGLFGGRNSPASAYAMYAPIRYFDMTEGLWIGGQFWDSRATGHELGDPLADQALRPFLNPVEMANASKDLVVQDAENGAYGDLFVQICDPDGEATVEAAYDCIALSIAAFERTELFGQFNSKYDQYLAKCLALGGKPDKCAIGEGGKSKKAYPGILTELEWRGLQLFMGDNNNDGVLKNSEGAMCAACHVADWTPAAANVVVPAWAPEGMVPPVFTDFTYDNLGVPVNPEIAALIGEPQLIDLGLGPIVGDPAENGKFKVMTLRNIGLTAPYAHNGLFENLMEITHFYNTRDVAGAGWDVPEVPETINITELGNLGLSAADEDAIVAFMETLSDGWWTP